MKNEWTAVSPGTGTVAFHRVLHCSDSQPQTRALRFLVPISVAESAAATHPVKSPNGDGWREQRRVKAAFTCKGSLTCSRQLFRQSQVLLGLLSTQLVRHRQTVCTLYSYVDYQESSLPPSCPCLSLGDPAGKSRARIDAISSPLSSSSTRDLVAWSRRGSRRRNPQAAVVRNQLEMVRKSLAARLGTAEVREACETAWSIAPVLPIEVSSCCAVGLLPEHAAEAAADW